MNIEIPMIKAFQQNALTFLSEKPSHEWEWMFLMQHYGVPTRLLDWSESPLVGLYFSVYNSKHYDKDGCFFILTPSILNANSGNVRRHPRDILCFGHDDILEDYIPSKVNDLSVAREPVAVVAPRTFERLRAQAGVFTIFHRNTDPLDSIDDARPYLKKLIIPAGAKENILKELEYLGIDELALFPELVSVGKKAMKGMIQ